MPQQMQYLVSQMGDSSLYIVVLEYFFQLRALPTYSVTRAANFLSISEDLLCHTDLNLFLLCYWYGILWVITFTVLFRNCFQLCYYNSFYFFPLNFMHETWLLCLNEMCTGISRVNLACIASLFLCSLFASSWISQASALSRYYCW